MSATDIFAQAIKTGNSVINVTVNNIEYVAESLPFESPDAEAWKCYANVPIEGGRFIKHAPGLHAPGLHAPGWNGENLPNLTYRPLHL